MTPEEGCKHMIIGGDISPSCDYTDAGWHKVIGINLDGVMYTQRAAIRAMKKSGMTEAAAWEHAGDNIRVNAVGPAFIRTPLVEKSLDQATLDVLKSQHAFGRLGEPEEVAELVAWLASDGSSFATGTFYPIDGGYLAR